MLKGWGIRAEAALGNCCLFYIVRALEIFRKSAYVSWVTFFGVAEDSFLML